MSAKQPARPMVDVWYKTTQGDMFEVVAVDEQEDAIQIQYLDGAVEELDDDTWSSLEPKIIDTPREAMADGYDGEEDTDEDFNEVSDLDSMEGGWSGTYDDFD